MANQAVQVAGVVVRDEGGRYLLVQEAQARAYKLWGLPGGQIDDGETYQQAAIREALEEIGVMVQLVDQSPLLIDKDGERNVEKRSFYAKITSGDLNIKEDEILDAKWLTVEEVRDLAAQGKTRSVWVLNSILEVENRH